MSESLTEAAGFAAHTPGCGVHVLPESVVVQAPSVMDVPSEHASAMVHVNPVAAIPSPVPSHSSCVTSPAVLSEHALAMVHVPAARRTHVVSVVN